MEIRSRRNSSEIANVLQKAMEENNIRGKLIFGMLAGSHAYNLSTETSDKDYLGVYVADVSMLLSLHKPLFTVDNRNNNHKQGKDPSQEDMALYELSDFCKRVIKGDPRLLEAVFLQVDSENKTLVFQTDVWREFQTLKYHLLTLSAVKQYLEFAQGKIRKYYKEKAPSSGNNESYKRLYHAVRVLNEGHRIVNKEPPKVGIDPNSDEWREYMAIRKGNVDVVEVENRVKTLLEDLQLKYNTNPQQIPIQPEQSLFNDFVITIRKHSLTQHFINKQYSECTIVRPDYVNTNDSKSTHQSQPDGKQMEMKQMAEKFLASFDVEGTVLFVSPSGSHAYNTVLDNVPDSKHFHDFLGIFAGDTDKMLSLEPPPISVDVSGPNHNLGKRITTSRGLVMVELTHAMRLLEEGNHRIVEAFALNNQCYQSQEWQKFINQLLGTNDQSSEDSIPPQQLLFHTIISGKTIMHYTDTAKAELSRVLRAKEKNKVLYQSMRLLLAALRIVKGELPTVHVSDSQERKLLLDIRTGLIPEQEVKDKARLIIQNLDLFQMELASRLSDNNNTATHAKQDGEVTIPLQLDVPHLNETVLAVYLQLDTNQQLTS